MKSCAIHQPHYFPWLGFLNKMASVDRFIFLDEVQIEKGSNMYRNKLCTLAGQEKHITVAFKKKGCLDIPYNEIQLDNTVDWQQRQVSFIENNYKACPFFTEIWDQIHPFFSESFDLLSDAVIRSIEIEMDLFGIKTETIKQSELLYDKSLKKNELLISLIESADCDHYLSGNGARKYMEIGEYEDKGITVEYQKFTYPIYRQGHGFVPNLSALDLLFNCGIDESRNIFWEELDRNKQR